MRVLGFHHAEDAAWLHRYRQENGRCVVFALRLHAVAYDLALLPTIWQLPTVDLFIGLLMQLVLVSFWVFFGLWC